MKVVKILMLIIATDIFLLYRNLIEILRSYLPIYKGNIDYYFLHAKPDNDYMWKDTDKDYRIIGDCLYVKGNETFKPGILDKTLKGMRVFNLDKYDFFIRTNISSFYIFDKFLPYISTLPRKRLYCSPALSWVLTEDGQRFYGSGSIIILSIDVAKYLCTEGRILTGREKDFDDIVIGRELWYGGGYKLMDLPFQYNVFDITDENQIQKAADDCPSETIYVKVRNDKINTPSIDKRLIFDSVFLNVLLYKHYNRNAKLVFN